MRYTSETPQGTACHPDVAAARRTADKPAQQADRGGCPCSSRWGCGCLG